MSHYDGIPAGTETPRSAPRQKWEISTGIKQFFREFGYWSFTFIVSILPFLIVYLLFTGPPEFNFLDLFQDAAILYVCVNMTALSLYVHRKITWVASLNIILLIVVVAIYVLSMSGGVIPLYEEIGREKLIARVTLISVSVGFITLLISSIMKEGESS